MKKVKMIFFGRKGVLIVLALNALGCCKVDAEADYKKYIPQEFRHFVPDVPSYNGDDYDGMEFDDEDSDRNHPHETSVESYGPSRYINKEFDDLKIYGPTTLDKVTVKNKTLIYGPLSGSDLCTKYLNVQGPVNIIGLKAETIEVTGPVRLKNSSIQGEVVINGPLAAYDSTFEGKINIVTNKMKLVDSNVATLYIRKDTDSSSRIQKVFLKGKTVVKDISFEKEGGEVIVRKPALIEGSVTGGKVIFKD